MDLPRLLARYRKQIRKTIIDNKTDEILKIYSNLCYEINDLMISKKKYERTKERCKKLQEKNHKLVVDLRRYIQSQKVLRMAVEKKLKEKAEQNNVQKNN